MKTFNNWREAVKFLWEEIKRNKPKEGANIQIETGKDGCKISSSSEGGGSGATGPYPCKIQHVGTVFYTVLVYANGKGEDYTDTGYAEILEQMWEDKLSVGDWILAYPTSISYTGEEE